MTDIFVYTSPVDPRARPLIDELTYEYDSRYGEFFDKGGAVKEMERYPPEAFQPPSGAFVLLLRNGEAIAGGAFMRYDEDTAEFKRIWTRNDQRRQGLAAKVVEELEARAAAQGYSKVYLTTGFRQPEAVGLYLKIGYTALFDTAADPATIIKLAFAKDLAVLAPTLVERHLVGRLAS